MGYKLFSLLALIFFASPTWAQQQCLDIFSSPSAAASPSELSQTTNAIRSLETDRYRFLKSDQSVFDYLVKLEKIQEAQLAALWEVDYQTLRPYFIEHYLGMVRMNLSRNSETFAQVMKSFDLRKIKLGQLLNPPEKYEGLSNAVITMTTRTNSLLAEFAAVVRFPDVQLTETTVSEVVELTGAVTPPAAALLEKVGHKELDFVSKEDGAYVWGEVKYLGRHKIYDEIAGNDIVAKMTNIKHLADLMPEKTRVVLIIVGPGRLSQTAIQAYLDQDIEVIYLTPAWR
jgi:hypothetical protein